MAGFFLNYTLQSGPAFSASSYAAGKAVQDMLKPIHSKKTTQTEFLPFERKTKQFYKVY